MRNNDEYYTKKNMIRKKYMRITVRVFTSVLLIVGFIGLLIPLRPKVSDVEKRELTHFPKPTWETFTNGEFFSGISTWYADTFPFRESLTSANAKFKKLYGITTEEIHGDAVQGDEIPDPDAELTSTPIPSATPTPEPDATIHDEPEKAGTIYVVDNRGFEIYGFSRDGADGYINMINTAATQLKDVATVYDILVPTSIAVNLDEENQKKINSSSQEDTFAYVYGHLDPSIVQVPVLDVLKKHNSEYLYFKTDHHWTADGAYYAYQELMNAKGVTPSPLSAYTKTEFDGFAPRESIRIKMNGGGMNFVHGGISLQEMVVPVIEYHYLRNDSMEYKRNKQKYDTKPVTVNLLSANRKISNMIFSLNFYQKDAVSANREAATYQVYFTDENGKQISDVQKIIADKISDNGAERTFRCQFNLKSLKYSNTATYYLVIADEQGLQMPQREPFQIDIAFAVDEFDFFS